MKNPVLDQIDRYQPQLPLEEASTCPASWYVDPRILELEQQTTFARSWQYACRLDQVREPGEFVTFELAGEPLAVVRGMHRRRFLVRADRGVDLSAYMSAWVGRVKLASNVRVQIDVDPYSFL